MENAEKKINKVDDDGTLTNEKNCGDTPQNMECDTLQSKECGSKEEKNTEKAQNTSCNKFIPNSRYFTIVVYGLMLVFGSVLIFVFVGNFQTTVNLVDKILSIMSPFLIGAFIAFILYPMVNMFYNKLFKRVLHLGNKISKILAILLTYLIVLGIFIIVLVYVMPQVYSSLSDITVKLPEWYSNVVSFVKNFQIEHESLSFINFNFINEKLESVMPSIMEKMTSLVSSVIPYIVTTSMVIVKGLLNIIIAVMVSVYMLTDHKMLFYHFNKISYAVMRKEKTENVKKILKDCSSLFLNFFVGKAIDSLIIGIICYILMLILKLPYAVLISVIVGITNIIPYFGPYLGGAIGAVIIVIVNPIQVIIFLVLILAIQQFDGLILGPKILGDKTGLRPIWVIFAITVGGSLFGVAGMIFGVPCVAVMGYLLNMITNHLLEKRNVTVEPYKEDDAM